MYLFSWLSINVLISLYSNFIKEYLSFLFSIIFKFVVFFSDFIFIYTSTFTLFLSSYEFLLSLNKYTLYSTWIHNSLSGRKLNTIRLLISTSLFCKILMINVRVEAIRIQHDVCTFVNRIYITRKQTVKGLNSMFNALANSRWPRSYTG